MRMLGSPHSAYFGVSVDRLRNYIPSSYLQPPKIIPPPLSPAGSTGLLSPIPTRSSRLIPNPPTGSDAIGIGSSRRLNGSDFRHLGSKVTSVETSTPPPPPSSSSSPSSSGPPTSILSSPKSSSSLVSFSSSYPPGPIFPGLSFNPMTSAIALKMGMFNSTQQQQHQPPLNIHNHPTDVLTKQSPKTPTNVNSPHPTSLHPPFGSSSAPSSSVSSVSSSSSSSTSEVPQAPLFSYPRFFTSFLTQEEQQQYMAMANLQAAAKGPQAFKATPSLASRNYLELAMLVCNTFRGKLFPCPHCRYVTDRRNNLKRHVATMHQACDKQLECCGVTFATKASLREHIAIFHHNGYSCTFCGRRFCRKALLKRHLSVHNGQKDYTCPHCDYATSHKSNLERHKRIHARLPENGESPVFPDTSMDDDMDDVDFKNRSMIEIAGTSTAIDLPFYYEHLHKSFTVKDGMNLPGNTGKMNMTIPGQREFLHNPYYFKDRNSRSSSDISTANHVTDLTVTSIPSAEEDDSDSDIDIDSLDDTESDIHREKSGDDDLLMNQTSSKPPSYSLEHCHDDNHPLNLVKVRQEDK